MGGGGGGGSEVRSTPGKLKKSLPQAQVTHYPTQKICLEQTTKATMEVHNHWKSGSFDSQIIRPTSIPTWTYEIDDSISLKIYSYVGILIQSKKKKKSGEKLRQHQGVNNSNQKRPLCLPVKGLFNLMKIGENHVHKDFFFFFYSPVIRGEMTYKNGPPNP